MIEISTENMNISPSKKYGFAPERVERESLRSEKFKTLFNMHRLERSEKTTARLDRYDDKVYERKKKKLPKRLNVGERVYVLAGRIKKKSTPGKFYKEMVQNISYFKKETIYVVRERKKIDDINSYWIKSSLTNVKKRFVRSELFALKDNFI